MSAVDWGWHGAGRAFAPSLKNARREDTNLDRVDKKHVSNTH